MPSHAQMLLPYVQLSCPEQDEPGAGRLVGQGGTPQCQVWRLSHTQLTFP